MNTNIYTSFVKIPDISNCTDITIAHNFVLMICDGDIYGFGDNDVILSDPSSTTISNSNIQKFNVKWD